MPKRPRDTNPGTSASPKDEGSAVGSDATMRLNERENAIAVHDLAAGSGASSRSSSSSSASVRDELEDLSAPLSSLTSSSSDSDNSVDADDLKDRLLTHAKLTAATHVQPQDVADAAPSLADRLSNSTASKQAQQKSRALQKMRLELTRPVAEVSSSTALAVVDASGDSEQVLAKLVSSKAPKAAPAEAKKLRRLTYVDHRTIHYQNIRKDFYVVPPDMRGISAADMKQLLKELDGAKLHGNNPPRPLRSWDSAGLPDAVLSVLESKSYKQPFAVQSLGVPALMSGRDLLVSAKTGSGKTLGYLLPLIRHVVDQPACRKGEGPIGLVLVPTQELAAQVLALAMDLSAAAGLRCVASYGSTPLSTNISQVKAGCEVMIATPGRLLDLLTVNGGSAMALQRTSFVVVDEADRMFDSGFMEHVEAFLKNVRPDRQLALVSATMPRELRRIILRHLRDPLEISIGGGTSIPATNVEQVFHFFNAPEYDVDEAARGPEERFLRLLQIIGEESPNGDALVLIFTKRRDEVDDLIARLSVMGYNKRVATLYSGMDPIDREFALEHFSPGNQFILIATGVAERGLDIPFLDLVINYSLPNHYEGYVHRIGRTGRAGRPGKAVNFFVRGVDDDIAPEMVEGLERAGKQVPEELYERANKMRELRKDGTAHHSSGFFRGYLKGKVQHFADRETKQHLKDAAKAAGLADYLSSSSDSEEGSDSGHSDADIEPVVHNNGNTQSTALSVVRTAAQQSGALVLSVAQEDRVAKALAFAKKTTDVATGDEGDGHTDSIRFQSKYVINDLPNAVRGRLQSAKFLREICSEVEVSIVKKGIYFDARLKHSYRLKEGDEPLYLLIIGKTTEAVRAAKRKLDEAKEEAKERARQHGLQSSIGAQL